jgi:hypothetical protein
MRGDLFANEVSRIKAAPAEPTESYADALKRCGISGSWEPKPVDPLAVEREAAADAAFQAAVDRCKPLWHKLDEMVGRAQRRGKPIAQAAQPELIAARLETVSEPDDSQESTVKTERYDNLPPFNPGFKGDLGKIVIDAMKEAREEDDGTWIIDSAKEKDAE